MEQCDWLQGSWLSVHTVGLLRVQLEVKYSVVLTFVANAFGMYNLRALVSTYISTHLKFTRYVLCYRIY